jgi:hypothetical protein
MAALNPIPMGGMIVITARDDELNRAILERVTALGVGLADEFRQQNILLVRDVLNITPPNSGSGGRGGQQQGQAAIGRDLFLMGFVPVEIKGFRQISHVPAGNVKGRHAVPIEPVKVRTRLNPKFSDPDAFHAERIASLASKRATKRGRFAQASRGGAQAFYVSISKYRAMRSRLYKAIGKLAAPWLPGLRAINNGSLPYWVPAFMKRHEESSAGRARYSFNFDPNQGKLFIHLVNVMPETASSEAADTQRRIEYAKGVRINTIRRGLQGRAQRIAREGR